MLGWTYRGFLFMALTLLIMSADEVSLFPFNIALSKGNDRLWTGGRKPTHQAPSLMLICSVIFNVFFIYCTFLRCSNLNIQSVCTGSHIMSMYILDLREASRMPLTEYTPENWSLEFRLYVQCSKEIGLVLLHANCILSQNN